VSADLSALSGGICQKIFPGVDGISSQDIVRNEVVIFMTSVTDLIADISEVTSEEILGCFDNFRELEFVKERTNVDLPYDFKKRRFFNGATNLLIASILGGVIVLLWDSFASILSTVTSYTMQGFGIAIKAYIFNIAQNGFTPYISSVVGMIGAVTLKGCYSFISKFIGEMLSHFLGFIKDVGHYLVVGNDRNTLKRVIKNCLQKLGSTLEKFLQAEKAKLIQLNRKFTHNLRRNITDFSLE